MSTGNSYLSGAAAALNDGGRCWQAAQALSVVVSTGEPQRVQAIVFAGKSCLHRSQHASALQGVEQKTQCGGNTRFNALLGHRFSIPGIVSAPS